MKSIEYHHESNRHEIELSKQNALSRNLSIVGVRAAVNEDLNSIALKNFSLIGCHQTNAHISS